MSKYSPLAFFCLSLVLCSPAQTSAAPPSLPGYPCDRVGASKMSDDQVFLIACLRVSNTVPSLVWKPMTPLLMDTAGNITASRNLTTGGTLTTGGNVTTTGSITASGAVKSSANVEATTGVKVGTTSAACNTNTPAMASTLRMNGSNLEYCNGTAWVSLSMPEPPKGTICGYATNDDSFDPAAAYCKGYNVRHGCPAGYTQSHWYVTDWGNGHLWFCTKQ